MKMIYKNTGFCLFWSFVTLFFRCRISLE